MSACSAPPAVNNGQVISSNTSAEYSCVTGFQMSGSKIITCDPTSGWGKAPTCDPIQNTFTTQFAPDWLLYLLAVLMTLLTLSCLACSIYYCCCRATGAAVFPEGGAASSSACCPCGRTGGNSSVYERNNIHNKHTIHDTTVNRNHDVRTMQTTTIHGTDVKHKGYPDDVYTTHDGLILVPVKPYELHEYQKNTGPTKKAYPLHGTTTIRTETNGITQRSEKEGSDGNFKKTVKTLPLWMPHSKPVRDNNTSTH